MKYPVSRIWPALCLWALSVSVLPAQEIRVLALFPGKAMVSIDGTNRLLTPEKASPEGVRLISADSRKAVIEVGGQRDTYALGTHISGSYARVEQAEVRILRNRQGAFATSGSINGTRVELLVDTGATAVALSSVDADRLGIRFRDSGRPAAVTTAAGVVRGYAVTLDQVKVGDIQLPNVGAVVLEGQSPRQVLLGMTFLNRVKMEDRGGVLVLKSKF